MGRIRSTHRGKREVTENKLIKIQLDATLCRYLFTAKSLYMLRVSQHPSSGVLKTNCSLRYRSYCKIQGLTGMN